MGYSTSMKRYLPLIVLAALASGAFADAPVPEVVVEAASLGGAAELVVQTEERGVDVFVDYAYKGNTPATVTGLAPGKHRLILRDEGYYDFVLDLNLAADTRTTVIVALELRTGYLAVSANPAWAEVVVDDDEVHPLGVLELPSGQRLVEVRAFGYLSETSTVLILDRAITTLMVDLDRAPFVAENVRASAERFNPLNAGARGVAEIRFRVSAPGRGSLTVRDQGGAEVATLELEPFATWDQRVAWDGRSNDGTALPDGTYTATLTAWPEEGTESERPEWVFDLALEIDSSLVLVPAGRCGVLTGAVHAPDALPPATDAFGVDFGAVFLGTAAGDVTGGADLAARFSLEGSLEAGVGIRALVDGPGTGLLALRLGLPLPRPVAASLVLDGRLSASDQAHPSGIGFSLPLGLGTRFFNLTLAPDVGMRWADGFAWTSGLAVGVQLSDYALGAALSAKIEDSDLADGYALGWPVRAAGELRFIPPGLAFTIRLWGGMAFAPEPVSWEAGLSLSTGF